jgi:FkbM family methyltransferase
VRYLNRIVQFLYFALENKNNDHKTNGEFWLMEQLSKTNARTIFDVGANVGKWSTEARALFSNGSIYAFEPMPEVFEKLKLNVSNKPKLHIFNFALSSEKGVLTFNYYPNSILFSSIYNHYRGGEAKRIDVPCVDGDSFCDEHKIDEIDFLKLDAEGSEHFILKGFKRMLALQKIRAVQFEYGVLNIDSKFLLKDYFELFSSYGYSVGKIFPNHISFDPYHWTQENFIGPNYVAIRNTEIPLIKALTNS